MNEVVVGGGANPCQDVPTAVLFNDGHGRFPSITQVLPRPPFGFDSPIDIAVGDLNGDGAPDIVLGYNKETFTGLWLQVDMNDGHGHFVDETAQRLPPQADNDVGGFYNWIQLVDLNGDGHVDIATGLETGGDHRSPYWLNDGTGHFVSLQDNLGFGADDTYTLADMGGYRGLDVVYGESGIAIAKARWPKGRLYVTIGPGSYFSFIDESGRDVQTVVPGYHDLVVWSRSPTSCFGYAARASPTRARRTRWLCRDFLFGVDVAAEIHQRLDRFGDERGRLVRVRERVRAGLDRIALRRIHLGLDHARVAVVDRAQACDRPALALRVPGEELARGGVLFEEAHEPALVNGAAVTEAAAA